MHSLRDARFSCPIDEKMPIRDRGVKVRVLTENFKDSWYLANEEGCRKSP